MQSNVFPLNRTIMLLGKRQSGKSTHFYHKIMQQKRRIAQKQRLLTLLKHKIEELENQKMICPRLLQRQPKNSRVFL